MHTYDDIDSEDDSLTERLQPIQLASNDRKRANSKSKVVVNKIHEKRDSLAAYPFPSWRRIDQLSQNEKTKVQGPPQREISSSMAIIDTDVANADTIDTNGNVNTSAAATDPDVADTATHGQL